MHFGGFFTILVLLFVVLSLIRIIGKAAAAAENSRRDASVPPSNPLTGFLGGGARNEAWMEAAYGHRLEYVRPNGMGGRPSLRGEVRGLFTEVHIESSVFGNIQTVATVMFSRPLNLDLLIVLDDEPVLGERFTGRKTYRISGVENPRLQCSASGSDALKRFLTPARLNSLKNVIAFYRYFEISDRYVLVKLNGECRDAEVLSNLIEFTASLAALLEEGGSVSSFASLSSARSAPIPVEESEPVPELRPRVEKTAPVSPAPEPETVIPEPPVVSPAVVPEPVVESVQPEPEPEPVVPEPSSSAPLDQASFAASLFSASFPGPKEQEIFAAAKGTRVEWSGLLRSSYSFGNDFVLGAGPAVKATFEIAEVTGAYSMKSKIRATVRLPESAMPLLRNHNGESFRFSGVLEKMEPYARELILLDGELLT